MTIKLGMVLDPLASIKPSKDTSVAMLLAAQARDWQIYSLQANQLSCRQGISQAVACELQVFDHHKDWYQVIKQQVIALSEFDVIIVRKDPPFNMAYIYMTYILEQAQSTGTLIINNPRALRDTNEKFILNHFPDCCPATLVSSQQDELNAFIQEHQQVILKPLDGMGGRSIFYVQVNDININAIIDNLTCNQLLPIMAQRYIPAIKHGDKRIILIDGKPMPYCLRRVPAKGKLTANLASGGQGIAEPITERDLWLCQQVGPYLTTQGLHFVGLDVIGDYITEINVTSPTCVREIEAAYPINICEQFLDSLKYHISINANRSIT